MGDILMRPLEKHYLICYDVIQQKRRKKVAKLLLDYGHRVQKSVFELYLTELYFEECVNKLAKIIAEEDSIRVYILHAASTEKMLLLGNSIQIKQLPAFKIV